MKRFFAGIIVLLMLTTHVFAATLTVNIPNRTTISQNQYTVSVKITDNPGFASIQLELYYDPSVINCTKIIAGDVIKGMLSDTNPKSTGERTCAIISVAGMSNTTKDGTVATFVFDVPGEGDPKFDFKIVEIRTASGGHVSCNLAVADNYGTLFDEPLETDPPYTEPETNPPYTWPDEDETYPPYDEDDEEDEPDETEPPQADEDEPDEFEYPANLSVPFSDVTKRHWAYEYVGKAVYRKLVSGYPDGTFAPDENMTRAEFATLLWNMEGKPSATKSEPFKDVSASDWHYKAVAWAYSMGYVSGTSANTFSPDDYITREQAITILYRYCDTPSTSYNLMPFSDRSKISSYAVPAMSWAVGEGIITGVDSTHIAPAENATRAQLATIIVRYLDNN